MTFEKLGITAPTGMRNDAFTLRPIRAADAELDYAAVMESKEFLRKWEQSTWPEDDFTVEANREDMQKMEERHALGHAYGYTVMNPDETECLGCVYVMSPRSKMFLDAEITPVAEAGWSDVEAAVYFWVRASRLVEELDRRLLSELRSWFANEWPFGQVHYGTNEEFEQQVALIDSTDLELQFRSKRPKESGASLVYV